MSERASLFLVGHDYHLGDLLWLTPVLDEYRRQRRPDVLMLGCPDRPISRILEHNPVIDELLLGDTTAIRHAQAQRYNHALTVHDLHIVSLGRAMLQDWRSHWPWLYYHDLWFQPRGQWLATFLHLGQLQSYRPILALTDDDRTAARSLAVPYVLLAPHIGQYSLPGATAFWQRMKGWGWRRWIALAALLRREGFEPITLAAPGQSPVPGTRALIGLPIRQVAGIVERAAGLVTAESGLWFVAAALSTPFVIVPWWLPRTIDWPGPMHVPHRIVYREQAAVRFVLLSLLEMIHGG